MPQFCNAKTIGISAMSTPSGSTKTPCSRMISLTVRAASSDRPTSGATEPRKPVMPAREFSGLSQGACKRWAFAAEPKSHRIGSPPRVSSAKRATLSRAHSPMVVLVRYRMLFMSKTSTAPRPAFAIACWARPRRYVWSRRKSTRSSQSTCIRPGAGTEVTVNSGRPTIAILGLEPVGDRTGVRNELEIRRPGFELEQGGEIAIAEAVLDQLDDDRLDESRDGCGDLELAGRVQAQLEILAQQVAGKGRGEIQVDERRRLVLGEGRPHDAPVDEVQVIGPRDAAALGEHGGLGQDLRHHAQDEVVADLDQSSPLALADVGDPGAEHLQIGERGLKGIARSGDRHREPTRAGDIRVPAYGRRQQRSAQPAGANPAQTASIGLVCAHRCPPLSCDLCANVCLRYQPTFGLSNGTYSRITAAGGFSASAPATVDPRTTSSGVKTTRRGTSLLLSI